MKETNKIYELFFDYPASFIFDEDCLEICTDNDIHICLIESGGYGSSKMCEYVSGDEVITSEVQIDDYFKELTDVIDFHSHEFISVTDFVETVKGKFRQLRKEKKYYENHYE